MSKQNSLKVPTCILKVNIDCKGCARKVTKQLQKIKGVYSVRIDAEEEQGKVIVAGNVDPAILIKKLNKSGKHAVLWDDYVQLQQRESMNVIYNPQNYPINNNYILQVDDNNNNSKGGRKNEKSQNQKGQKGGDGQGHIVAHFQNMEVPQNLKVPHHQNKQHKAVTFKNLPDDEFDSSDHFHDDDDEDDDDDSDEEEEGYSHGPPIPIDNNNNNNNYKKVMPMMRNGLPSAGQMTTEPVKLMNNHNHNHNHKGNGNGNYGSVIEKKNGKTSNGGVVGRLKSFGKKNKKGEGVIYNGIIQDKKGHGKLGGGHGNLNSNSKNDHDFDFHDNNGKGSVNGGNMGPMGNNKNGGGGYQQHQGVQMQYAPSYNIEQQQQMEMMMNQRKQQQQQHQHMMMNQREQQQQQQANMYPQPAPSMMMYDSQQPNNYYMPPPMPSHPRADPITHSLSDENPNACTIM